MRAAFIELCTASLLVLGAANALQVCSRNQYTIAGAFFQRVDLPTAVDCVERCIEYMEICHAALFVLLEDKTNGVCQLHPINSQDSNAAVREEFDADTTIFELLENCPLDSTSEMMDEINEDLRRALAEPRKTARALSTNFEDDIIQKADAFVAEREALGTEDLVSYGKLEKGDKGYALMKAMDESSGRRPNPSRNPFDTPSPPPPPFRTQSKERPSFQADNSVESIDVPSYGPSPVRDLQPIRPVQVLHHGIVTSAQHDIAPLNADAYRTLPCTQGTPCSSPLHQDRSPCPARQGDPCAPRPKCGLSSSVYPEMSCQVDTPAAEWSEWTTCSVSCGTGMRTRTCMGGFTCPGLTTAPCFQPPCQNWGLWGPWTACSATCGQGQRSRRRQCLGGNDCIGGNLETQDCQLPLCAEWSPWGSWEGCTQTCGQGREKRYRRCEGGLTCPGLPVEERGCDRGPCPFWTDWTAWAHCSASCGGGETIRTRDCINGPGCIGEAAERLDCNQHPCPTWTDWTAWTLCEQKCGEESVRLRNRVCLYKGMPYAGCEGTAQDQSPCPVTQCPKWSDWGDWTECSQTCGQGTQLRSRTCNGNGCSGSSREMRFCQIAVCPYWNEWAAWSGCSVTCGLGICERRRSCVIDDLVNLPSLDELEAAATASDEDDRYRPARMTTAMAKATIIAKHREMGGSNETDLPRNRRAHGILDNVRCDGSEVERKSCDAGPCCGWEPWGSWSPCIGCGVSAVSKRTRTCPGQMPTPPLLFQEDASPQTGTHSDPYAVGDVTYHRPTLLQQTASALTGLQPIVPVNGYRGKRDSFQFGGVASARSKSIVVCNCEGSSQETRQCPNAPPCESVAEFSHDSYVTGCEWTEWGQWCGCERCRPGREVRRRFCDLPARTPGGPTRPDPSCRCDGRDVEERTCRVNETCLSTARMPLDRPTYPRASDSGEVGKRKHTSREKQDGSGEATGFRPEPLPSTGPIVSTVEVTNIQGRALLRARPKPNDEYIKDSLCRWSIWSAWTSCQPNRLRQRDRFCIRTEATNCQCMGLSTEETSCVPDNNIASSVEYIALSSHHATKDIDKQVTSSQEDDRGSEESGEAISREKKCEWARWSQWSACTATCGKAEKIRRRRCPCGEERECGGGITTETEACEEEPCQKTTTRPYPKFSIVA